MSGSVDGAFGVDHECSGNRELDFVFLVCGSGRVRQFRAVQNVHIHWQDGRRGQPDQQSGSPECHIVRVLCSVRYPEWRGQVRAVVAAVNYYGAGLTLLLQVDCSRTALISALSDARDAVGKIESFHGSVVDGDSAASTASAGTAVRSSSAAVGGYRAGSSQCSGIEIDASPAAAAAARIRVVCPVDVDRSRQVQHVRRESD